MRIAVISDTHGLLRPQVLQVIETCDYILHGGDINTRQIVNQLQSMKPLYVVRGNNDKEWAQDLPPKVICELEKVRIFMVHNKKEIPKDLKDIQVVIYGHSHKYEQREENGRLYLNPGSCGKRRLGQAITMAVLTVQDGSWQAEKIEIPHD